jgi:putative tricarboxylic transport membrane protein
MSRILKRKLLPALALLLAVLLAACGGGVAGGGGSEAAGGGEGEAAGDYPSEPLSWTIAFGPGGGNDILSRTLIDIIDKNDLYSQPIVAENREGGSGAVGWGYLHNQAGNPYHISTTSGSFITTPLEADTPWDPTSFTPVALLASESWSCWSTVTPRSRRWTSSSSRRRRSRRRSAASARSTSTSSCCS